MDSLIDLCYTVTSNCFVKLVWAVLIVVLLVSLVFINREKFAFEFREQPVAAKANVDVLGIGQALRFSSTDSSTNRGNSYLPETAKRVEHMVGAPEPPVFQSSVVGPGVEWYDRETTTGAEAFSNKGMYEFYANNPDNKLVNILHGN